MSLENDQLARLNAQVANAEGALRLAEDLNSDRGWQKDFESRQAAVEHYGVALTEARQRRDDFMSKVQARAERARQ